MARMQSLVPEFTIVGKLGDFISKSDNGMKYLLRSICWLLNKIVQSRNKDYSKLDIDKTLG